MNRLHRFCVEIASLCVKAARFIKMNKDMSFDANYRHMQQTWMSHGDFMGVKALMMSQTFKLYVLSAIVIDLSLYMPGKYTWINSCWWLLPVTACSSPFSTLLHSTTTKFTVETILPKQAFFVSCLQCNFLCKFSQCNKRASYCAIRVSGL